MLYAFRWNQEGWVKLGWGKDPMQRASDGWWESSHPTIEKYGERGLCGKLTPPDCELIGLWEVSEEAEEKKPAPNEGVLKHGGNHNEFYEESEWPKIYRELMTWFAPLPLPPANYPPPAPKTRKECYGGRKYYCEHCPRTFDKSWNWIRHLRNVHGKSTRVI